MSRDELLRQAAEAPDQRLIVPPVIPPQKPAAPVQAPAPAPVQAVITDPSVFKKEMAQTAEQNAARFKGVESESRAEAPKALVMDGSKPAVAKIASAQVEGVPVASKKGGSSPLPGVAAAVGLLVLAGGVAYVLALQGLRVPLAYGIVTGLNASGLEAAKKAVGLVADKGSVYGTGDVSVKALTGGDKPPLPGSTDEGSDAASSEHALSFQATSPSLTFDLRGDGLIAKTGLAVENASEVPLQLQTGLGEAEDEWVAYLPAASSPEAVRLKREEVRGTLLYPLLRSLPLQAMLDAVKAETGYEKVLVRGSRAARHTYSLGIPKLEAYFPVGATVDRADVSVDYLWKSGLPAHAQADVTFKYLGQSYRYRGSWDYLEYAAEATPEKRPEVAEVLAVSLADAKPASASYLLSGLGTSASQVPNQLEGESVPTEQVPSVPAAITPSGTTVTSALSPITAVPPRPDAVASSAALQRDAQRLKDMADLQQALERYKTKYGAYPKTGGIEQTRASRALLSALVPEYMTALPVDPLNEVFWYEYSSDGTAYRIRAVAENAGSGLAKQGAIYSYYEVSK